MPIITEPHVYAPLSEVCDAMQTLLTTSADALAQSTGFIQRQRKLTGSSFAQMLTFGWLDNPEASYEQLVQMGAAVGVELSAQALEQRFTPKSAEFLKALLEESVGLMLQAEPVSLELLSRFAGELLSRFAGVYLLDSSIITLPAELASLWPACGGSTDKHPKAALKLQVGYDIQNGMLQLSLESGRTQDKASPMHTQTLPKGTLRLADLGYFSLPQMGQMTQDDVFWLSRVQSGCVVYTQEGERYDLMSFLRAHAPNAHPGDTLEVPIFLGAEAKLPCRLMIQRVPKEVEQVRRRRVKDYARKKGVTPTKQTKFLTGWTLLVTNAPPEKLTLEDALVLLRVRWQIELLFKLWKQHGRIDEWRSQKPWRILTEVYAKLVAMVLQHWIFLVGVWHYPDRSLVKASLVVRQHATSLACAFAEHGTQALQKAVRILRRCLSVGTRLNKRKKKPSTYQTIIMAEGEH